MRKKAFSESCCSCESLIFQLHLFDAVLASFPLCDMTEEDLTQNPQFCKLLATLTQHVDQTGLTVPLKTELEKVSAGL